MTNFKTALLAAAIAVPALGGAFAASAQVNGIAVVDPEDAIGNSNAWKTAQTQLQTTYKAQLDQANTRTRAIQAELQPLITDFQTAQKAPGATDATLRPKATAIQAKQQAGEAEIQRITLPVARARAYAIEQIQAQLKAAVDAAAARKRASIVLGPQSVVHLEPAGDITADVTTELNRLVPSVSIAPPANWQPGQQGQQGAPAPAAPAAGTTRPTQGR